MTQTYGWYLTVKELAESGIFNQAGMTPIRAAQRADLYEAFTYLSARKAEGKFLENLYKQTD